MAEASLWGDQLTHICNIEQSPSHVDAMLNFLGALRAAIKAH